MTSQAGQGRKPAALTFTGRYRRESSAKTWPQVSSQGGHRGGKPADSFPGRYRRKSTASEFPSRLQALLILFSGWVYRLCHRYSST